MAKSDGFSVVIGHRDVLMKYSDQPWSDVLGAATMGVDGLKISTSWEVPRDHFALRLVKSARRGDVCGLFIQNWNGNEPAESALSR